MRKYDEENSACLLSHPVRGAWIEIINMGSCDNVSSGRTPSGVRGLKCRYFLTVSANSLSHPVRGAWIEIRRSFTLWYLYMSHPVRGAWIEIDCNSVLYYGD